MPSKLKKTGNPLPALPTIPKELIEQLAQVLTHLGCESAFDQGLLKAIEAALTASAVMGPRTNCSINSLGIVGNAGKGLPVFFNLLGIHAPALHVMPRTQKS